MIARVYLQDGRTIVKEVVPTGRPPGGMYTCRPPGGMFTLDIGEPAPDGTCVITGYSVEGLPGPPMHAFVKLANGGVNFEVQNYEEIDKLVRDELFAVEFTKYEWLPLLMGKFRTESARRALKKRLME